MEGGDALNDNSNRIHVDIISNILYVMVGFSLVTGILGNIEQITDFSDVIAIIVIYAILVVPVAMFVTHIHRTPPRDNVMLAFSYIFVLAVSIFSYTISTQNPGISIQLIKKSYDIRTLSISFMLAYVILLECELTKLKGILKIVKEKPKEMGLGILGFDYGEEIDEEIGHIFVLILLFIVLFALLEIDILTKALIVILAIHMALSLIFDFVQKMK